jgi:hypothetical protein
MKKYLCTSALSICCSLFCFSQNFIDSNLPIVVFNTGGKTIDSAYYPTVVISMGIIDNGMGNRNHLSDPFTYTGNIQIKTHGNSTMWYPKKSWNITTVNSSNQNLDISLMGMPKEHDWVFKASYEDKSFVRDEVAFKIFTGMGHYASRLKYFELVVDGNYRGLYQAEEKIKRGKERVNVSKLKANDLSGDSLSGGYLVSIDRLKIGDQGWTSQYPSNATNDSANIYLYDYPKPDSMPQVQKDYIHHLFDKFETVVQSSYWNNADSGYVKYINDTSFIDKFLIEEISRNTDGYRLKAWFYKNKDSKGDGKIHAGPIWDYAIGWGNCAFSGGDNPWWWQYQENYYQNFIPFWWRKILTDNNFQNKLQCRYRYLRSNILNQSYLYANIDSFATYLNEAQIRNFQRWPIMGQNVFPNPQPPSPDYAGEISRLKWWINERINWFDTYIPGMCSNATIVNNSPNSTAINVYPNPFTNNFNVAYRVSPEYCNDGKAQVVIELFNILGDRVSLWFTDRATGAYAEELSELQIPPGMYTMKLSINNKTFSKKIVKTE